MYAVDSQPWDPSVKAMTQFPSVLDNMAKNLSWTSALGEAYATQGADVMSAVQVLRAKAQAAGNLNSSSQIKVVQQSPQVIVIQAANPQVVYVPVYNPAVVYGTPYVTPGYSTAAVVRTAVVAFGVGIAMGAMMNSGVVDGVIAIGTVAGTVPRRWCTTVGSYYGNTAWRGTPHLPMARMAPRTTALAIIRPPGPTHVEARSRTATAVQAPGQAYNPSTGTYARGATTSNAYGTTSAAQAYNPRTGASASTVQNSNAYGAREPRRSQRTATLHTRSTRRTLTEPQAR